LFGLGPWKVSRELKKLKKIKKNKKEAGKKRVPKNKHNYEVKHCSL
jgi:cytochrome oxidase assembly protein ShyY1